MTTTYEIGDYYENGFVKGIVIYIDSEGKSGTVVSFDETEAVWSYKYEEPMAFPTDVKDITWIVYIIWKDGGRIIPGSCGAVKRMLWELKLVPDPERAVRNEAIHGEICRSDYAKTIPSC